MPVASRVRVKTLRRVGQIIVVLFVAVLAATTLHAGWADIVAYEWDLDYPALIIAFSLMLTVAAFYVYLWKSILERLGTPLSLRKSYRIFFLSQLARYIPGQIWGVLGLVYLSRREGVSEVISGASVAMQLLLQVVSGIIVFAVTLPFWPGVDSATELYVLLVFLPVGLIMLHPALVSRGLKLALRLTGQQEMEPVGWGYSYLLGQLGLWGVFWLLNGVAYRFLIGSIYSSLLPGVPALAGVFAIAWVAGFLNVLTPAGLGTMEITLVLLLSFWLPPHVATIVAIWTRVARTAIDLVCAAIAWRL